MKTFLLDQEDNKVAAKQMNQAQRNAQERLSPRILLLSGRIELGESIWEQLWCKETKDRETLSAYGSDDEQTAL